LRVLDTEFQGERCQLHILRVPPPPISRKILRNKDLALDLFMAPL
jgi:hypothetical protein